MTIYGNESRVSVDIQGGGISSVGFATAEKAVIFARGDTDSGTVDENDPTRVSGSSELSSVFGDDTEIAEYMEQAASNGMAYSRLYGVVPEEMTVSDEEITGGSGEIDHTDGSEIENVPIVEDTELITFEGDDELDVVFKYETETDDSGDDFTELTPSEDTVYINPLTGEWVADSAETYTISYSYLDWQSAFDSATGVIEEQELGVWGVGSESQDVVDMAQSTVDPLRTSEWKMVRVNGLASPNATGDDDGAEINVSDYTDTIDAEATFLFGPGRLDGSTHTVIGAVTGITASNDIDEPILGESLSGVDSLEQTLNVPDQNDLSEEGVIPLGNTGAPSIEDSVGTSTETDWRRTHFSRKLADQLVLAARAIAKASRGKLNNENTESIVEQQIADELIDFVNDGVLRPNTEDDTRWRVNVERDDTNARELDISFGFTPTGVVDIVDVDATINF